MKTRVHLESFPRSRTPSFSEQVFRVFELGIGRLFRVLALEISLSICQVWVRILLSLCCVFETQTQQVLPISITDLFQSIFDVNLSPVRAQRSAKGSKRCNDHHLFSTPHNDSSCRCCSSSTTSRVRGPPQEQRERGTAASSSPSLSLRRGSLYRSSSALPPPIGFTGTLPLPFWDQIPRP